MSVKGGGEYPPFPLRVFGQDDFPLWGRGEPPNAAKEKAGILGPKIPCFYFFHTFLALFDLSYGLFGPFSTLFNEKASFLVCLGIFFL